MSIKQIISWGAASLIGSTIYHAAIGTDPDRASAMFGGGFSMLVTLALMAWMFDK
ncbi:MULTISPECIES: hypothetical protein [unclassified Mesorhizobium]|uniref:hypothetical protein n=1 Tax=unclassified Mesorhizobium TaxID=325217 RepID=UPI0015E2E1C9|nr:MULTISPECIES: hypothetical protein [unclassified Mesorhizobium]